MKSKLIMFILCLILMSGGGFLAPDVAAQETTESVPYKNLIAFGGFSYEGNIGYQYGFGGPISSGSNIWAFPYHRVNMEEIDSMQLEAIPTNTVGTKIAYIYDWQDRGIYVGVLLSPEINWLELDGKSIGAYLILAGGGFVGYDFSEALGVSVAGEYENDLSGTSRFKDRLSVYAQLYVRPAKLFPGLL